MLISEDGTTRSLATGMEWMDSTHQMLVRECWRDLLGIVLSKKHVILNGKAGRGKSLFVLFVIFEILHCAKRGKTTSDLFPTSTTPIPADLQIVYVDRTNVMYLATLTGVSVVTNTGGCPEGTHYYFSDNVDIGDATMGSNLTMGVTSGDDKTLKEYSKRVEGVADAAIKATVYMPSLDLKEVLQVFPRLDEQTLRFRFDVVGGNPRKIAATTREVEAGEPFYDEVKGALSFMFPEYVPSETGVQSAEQQLGKWAIGVVVAALEQAKLDSSTLWSNTDSSLFREYVVFRDYSSRREQFASVFLGLVADKLKQSADSDVMMTAKRLFGASGMGNAFEFTAHELLLKLQAAPHWCYKSTGEYVQLPLGNRRKVLIRGVGDISSLRDDAYGLPTICNFPIIDAVLPPAMGLQMTTSHTHAGSIERLPEILGALKITAAEDFTVVFVVPEGILPGFTFPSNLGAVKMYVTIPTAVTRDAFTQLFRDRKRKRATESQSSLNGACELY